MQVYQQTSRSSHHVSNPRTEAFKLSRWHMLLAVRCQSSEPLSQSLCATPEPDRHVRHVHP